MPKVTKCFTQESGPNVNLPVPLSHRPYLTSIPTLASRAYPLIHKFPGSKNIESL